MPAAEWTTSTNVDTTFSSGTRIEPLETGGFFATHVAWPGMWGTGVTPEDAANDLVAAFRACKDIWPNYPEKAGS